MKDAYAPLLRKASQGLSQTVGQGIRLTIIEELDSQHAVLRCRLVEARGPAPESVVVKQLPLDEVPRSKQTKNLTRFHNEWATLRFLGELPGESSISPGVYFSDGELGLIVLEDLGQRPSVQDVLYGNDPRIAGAALIHIGRGLGRLHTVTASLETSYEETQRRFDASTPLSDATLDLRQYQEALTDCFTALKIDVAADFFGTLSDVEAAVHGAGPFRALCHNDAGAHNFLLMDGHVKLLDYEFAGYQHALTDLVPARLAFPPSYRGRRSPPELVDQLEAAYRAEVSGTIPEAADDEIFAHEREKACAHLMLAKLVGMWRVYLQHRLREGQTYDRQGGRTPEQAEYLRRMNLTYVTQYLETTEAICFRPVIRDTIRSLENALLRFWPELAPLPFYPAFEKAS